MTAIILLYEERKRSFFVYKSKEVYAMIGIGAFADAIGMNLWVYVTQNTKSTTAAVLSYVGIIYCFLSDIFIFK